MREPACRERAAAAFPTARGPARWPERRVTGAGALPSPKQAPRSHQNHPSLRNQPLHPAAPAAGAVTHVHRQQQQQQQPQPQQQSHKSQPQSQQQQQQQPCKQSRLSSGSHGGTTEPCVQSPHRASSLQRRSGSDGAHGSKQSSSSDGDMWACLTRLFRVVVLKRSHLRHWLKTTSWKDESSSGVSVGSSRSRDHLDKAPLGLRNLGNTCFMNSIVQCLAHTRPLLEYCLKDGYVSEINSSTSSMKGALFEAFATLMKSIWRCSNGEYAISPQAFRSQIQKFAPRFMGYSQQDSQEFLHYLLQGLHEDINRITSRPRHLTTEIDDNLSESQKAAEAWKRYLRYDDSKIVDCFVGQLKSTLKCSVCGHKSVTFDPFWDLSLPIPKSSDPVTIQQCLSLFTKEEVLDGDEKPTCSHCKTRQKCTKSFTIHRCPKILVLHLKRFSPSERFRAKLNTRIEFPLTNLDLCPYMSNSHYVMYNLYAVSNHSGSTYSGHYTATCLHPKSGEWHECNDTKVSEVSASRVVSSEAYVLFYEAATQSSRL
ncbi:ubiquitin carboxyl-terminal hydrolase 2-like isoform X2 [Dermacentor variabilis]|uniref:ubiquitin carboxyl-terminal hydrolase 2-like isoform X2 n=1 Tax=Dermacentor variabilis TaxID=34621 RepID=UPI003F5C6C87